MTMRMAARIRKGKPRLLRAAVCMGMPALLFLQLGFLDWGERGDQLIERGENMSEVIPLVEYLGPLAPVALSPFFGIAMLSGSSYLSDWELIPSNAFLSNNALLQDPLVFLIFSVLTLFTSLPKFTKVTKPVAQAIDQLETYSGIATILVLQALMGLESGGDGEPVAYVAQAGFISMTQTGLIMVVSAVNIFVINTVKFLFEVLIWLSPVPTIDAIFEAGLKSLCGGLMVLYLWNPWLSALVNGILFLICLLLFRWAIRTTNYYRVVLFGPILRGLLRGFGLVREPGANSTGLPHRLRKRYPNPEVTLPVYPGSRRPGFPKRGKAYLIRLEVGDLYLARKKLFRGISEIPLRHVDRLRHGIIAHTVSVVTGDDREWRLNFSRKFSPCFEELARKLKAPVDGFTEPDKSSWREQSRALGNRAIQGRDGAFRKDLA